MIKKPFVIRDPIHGHITVAGHERIVVDHPITQRLRGIAQTGLAQLVWPAARTSRFEHSLGAMHLASRLFVAALLRAEEATFNKFYEDAKGLWEQASSQTKDSEIEGLLKCAGSGLRCGRALLPATACPKERAEKVPVLAMVEAALRLAALFHDLGHLPFSHDFENAFGRYAQELPDGRAEKELLLREGALHEEVGHCVVDLVVEGLLAQSEPATHGVYNLASRILRSVPPTGPGRIEVKADALQWLHSLVDGEIDCDRSDYLLRDGRALDFAFADYDLERLLENIELYWSEDFGYETIARARGLATVEGFFLARARSHAVLTRHHKAAQHGEAFRVASHSCLKERGPTVQFVQCLVKLCGDSNQVGAEEARQLLEAFSSYDDAWWTTELRQYRKECRDSFVNDCLDLLLKRKASFASLWKHNTGLTLSETGALNEAELADKRLRDQFKKEDMLIARHVFAPYSQRGDKASFRVRGSAGGAPEPISDVSALVRGLGEAWNAEPHFHVSARTAARNAGPAAEEKAKSLLLATLPEKSDKGS